MGPRFALSMHSANRELDRSLFAATNDLEQLVAAQRDSDVSMTDGEGTTSKSWVVVPSEDWEMIECSA